MRLFKRRDKRVDLVYEGKVKSVTRAMRSDNRYFPVVEVNLDFLAPRSNSSGEIERLDGATIYLDIEDALKLYEGLGHTLSAAIPRMPRPAGHYQYGEGSGTGNA